MGGRSAIGRTYDNQPALCKILNAKAVTGVDSRHGFFASDDCIVRIIGWPAKAGGIGVYRVYWPRISCRRSRRACLSAFASSPSLLMTSPCSRVVKIGFMTEGLISPAASQWASTVSLRGRLSYLAGDGHKNKIRAVEIVLR